jgi:hypothetical protein
MGEEKPVVRAAGDGQLVPVWADTGAVARRKARAVSPAFETLLSRSFIIIGLATL